MTDLHPHIRESNSARVRESHDVVELAVESLIDQAQLLGSVHLIVCVGKQSYDSVRRHRELIFDRLGLSDDAIVRIPHYSGANARVHKRDVDRYRELILSAISGS